MSQRQLSRAISRLVVGGVSVFAACGDFPSEPTVGPPAQMQVISGGGQSAFAGTELSQPIRLSVRDTEGRTIAGTTVTFAALGGGALVGPTTAVSDDAGTVAAPGWRLGRSAIEQTMRASADGITADITATVATDFHPVIRFFGDQAISVANQDVFANAVARVRGIITGNLAAVYAVNSGIDLDQCGIIGQPRLNEIIDDVIIFASIQSIDGPGGILARAGPCLVRSGAAPMTAVGIMSFDSSDLVTFLQGAAFEEVVTHEIIHVLGFGTLWTDRGFLSGAGTDDPRYSGVQAHHGCLTAGLSLACTSTLPVEAGGGPGTALSHWRESTFGNELLTGYYSASGNVLSVMTVGALADLGFLVNSAASDYTPTAAANRGPAGLVQAGWERLNAPVARVTPDGRLSKLK